MEMELSLLVPDSSPIKTLSDADQPGRRIVVYEKSANEEMVRVKLPKATRVLVPLSNHKKAFETIKAGEGDAFADLLYQTLANQPDMPGMRIGRARSAITRWRSAAPRTRPPQRRL